MTDALDPDCARVLERMGEDLKGFPANPSIEDRRAMIRTMAANYGPPLAQVARCEDRVIEADGRQVPVRIYWPSIAATPTPLLVHIHGGGWSIGDPVAYERVCRAYCETSGAIVVDVHYRRAPEHKYPQALEDCSAALGWAYANAPALGADPRLLAVTGDSAGGNLAAALCQRTDIPLALQILVYPVMSASATAAFASRTHFGDGRFFLRDIDIKNAEAEYLRTPRDGEEPGASPLLAPDPIIARLPPTFIITAGLDPLRDEGLAYVDRLRACGVDVRYHCAPGAIHAFVLFAGMVRTGADAIDQIGAAVRDARPRPLRQALHT